MQVNSVSVLICTFNRASRLARTLESFRGARLTGTCRVEILVVDNNSTDGTSDVIDDAARRSPVPMRRLFEPRQGKSFALNRGLAAAHGDLLALTDDDVTPAEDWIERIVQLFRTHDIVFAGGKVLPVWEQEPPSWIRDPQARDIWGPLALVDYGDDPFFYEGSPLVPRRPIGANMAMRRDMVERVGGWRTDLGRVNDTLISGEDHEIYFRLHAAGAFRGMYDPQLVVHHDVPSSRLRHRYFLRWFFASGQARALMAEALYPEIDFRHVPRIGGVPRFLYRELASRGLELVSVAARDRVEWRVRQLQAVRLIGFMWQRARLARQAAC